MHSAVSHTRARVAALSRSRKPDDPEYVAAQRDLAVAKLQAHVEKTVAEAPPLTPAQRDRIANILNAGVTA